MHICQRGRALVLGALLIVPWTASAAETTTLNAVSADPALIHFVQSVVDANPRVQAARSALEASGAYRDAASRPLYNPELSFEAENAADRTRALGISQTFDWGGKREARTDVAESDRLVVEAEYLGVRWAVTVELLDGLAQHQTGQERTELARSREALMDRFVNLAQRRYDAGDLAQVEFDLARLTATDARIQSATAAAELAEARQAVRNLTPRSSASDQWPTLPGALPSLPESAANPETLVLELPEVQTAQRRVDSAAALAELRRREQRPDPTLSVAGGDEDGETLIGLNLSIPLYIRNNFSNEVSAALSQRNQAEQMADDVMRRAYARLTSAAERYELSQGAWEAWQETGKASLARQTEQLQRLWEAGELSTTDYLVQLTATLNVQEHALDLRETLWRAWFEWLRASGQVDTWLGRGFEQ